SAAREPGLQEEVGELVEQRLQIDGVGELRAELRVRMPAHVYKVSRSTYLVSVASLNPFSVLVRHRNFRLFWIGQTLSLIGSWMQSMAQGWLALELTNNAFLVGLVAAVGSLPIVLFSMHAGVLADRYERLRLVKICQALLLLE